MFLSFGGFFFPHFYKREWTQTDKKQGTAVLLQGIFLLRQETPDFCL